MCLFLKSGIKYSLNAGRYAYARSPSPPKQQFTRDSNPPAAAHGERVGANQDAGIRKRGEKSKATYPDSAAMQKLKYQDIVDMFTALDVNGDGRISQSELIKGLKKNPSLAQMLGMPVDIKQEDGTREVHFLVVCGPLPRAPLPFHPPPPLRLCFFSALLTYSFLCFTAAYNGFLRFILIYCI